MLAKPMPFVRVPRKAAAAIAGLCASCLAAPIAQAQSGPAGFGAANGDAQFHHESPVAAFATRRGGGLDGPRHPGMAVAPVTPFLERGVQHRDSRPLATTPLADFATAPGDMPYRNDALRPPGGTLAALRGNADPIKGAVGYGGPGNTVEGYGQAIWRGASGYIRGFGRAVRAGDDYEDGDGADIPFAYRRNSQQLVLGLTPTAQTEIFGVVLRDEIDDDRTPSAGLDTIRTDRIVGRVGFEQRDGFGLFERVRGEVRVRSAEREHNNFGLRGLTGRRIAVDVQRRFVDGRLFADRSAGGLDHRLGVDWRYETRDGERRADSAIGSAAPTLDLRAASLFPDIAMLEVGPSYEAAFSASPDDHLRLGLGYRHVRATARDVDTAGEGPFANLAAGLPSTARNAYAYYYGERDVAQTDHLLKARLLYQREALDDRVTLFGELGRNDRAADTKERYWAGITPIPQAANRTIGNPGLRPEKHYEAGLGATIDGPDWIAFGRARRTGDRLLTGAWSLSAAMRGAYVDDFITRDQARGQEGVLQNDGALIFRNVGAALATVELDAQWNLTPQLSTRAHLVFSYGENLDDDRPLYGIAPFEANLLVDYTDRLGAIGTWSVGGKLRLTADQNRVDDDAATGAGLDDGPTEGFAVLDLYAGAQIYDRIGLRVGVENIFDATYREHIARSTLDFAQARGRVNAPGRSVFIRSTASF